ncbi:hypothetical protein [Defluviitalea saccharophila]|uniref:Uncharacterized protein n=1 Tax=Defluviitalea saccharophila TaxID=879970 RepID=A0ABZ2Y7E4_9FIRM
MILSNNNEEKYFVLTTSESTDIYKCHICRKMNSNSNQLFLVNEYYTNQITNSYLTIFTQLQGLKNFKSFTEIFTKDSKVYVVFNYINASLLKSKIENENPSIEERFKFLEAFCIALMKVEMLPLPLKCELLDSSNVNINSNDEIYFNYSLKLHKKANYVTSLDFTNRISDIIKMIFYNTKMPLCVRAIVNRLDEGSLNKLSNLYTAVQKLKDEYPQEKLDEELKSIALKKKNKRLIACIASIILLIGIPSTYYYLVRSEVIPAINIIKQDAPSQIINKIGTVEIKDY